jgi:uncharacterized protein VirK/YbjX
MIPSTASPWFFPGATGFLGGALFLAGEPAGALLCGAVAVAFGGWENLRRHLPSRAPARGVTLLTAAEFGYPPVAAGWRNKQAKFLLRAAWRRRATRAWLECLADPACRALWLARPRLTSKLQRPYLCRSWGVPERLAALTSHYAVLAELLAPAARSRIYGDGLTLVRLVHAASGRRVDLRLVYRDQFEKEGDLSLAVEDAGSRLLLAGLTFCLLDDGRRRVAWIGGVQASADPRTRGLVAEAAKDLHGLRPKALAVWALRQLATPWGIGQLRAVSDGQRVFRHWHRRSEFAAGYDEFWSESGGRPHSGGGWELPLVVPRRRREDLKPNRRRMYERRYSLLAELRAELLAAYSAVTPEADVHESRTLPRILEC